MHAPAHSAIYSYTSRHEQSTMECSPSIIAALKVTRPQRRTIQKTPSDPRKQSQSFTIYISRYKALAAFSAAATCQGLTSSCPVTPRTLAKVPKPLKYANISRRSGS